jgi:glycerol-3-phosphate dehydrogenase
MQRDINQLSNTTFDVIVVGAGIHGACVARDAALRGMSVALIDKGDLCAATSHNSLKIIHGGIRYLQHLNFKRTLESINEQKYWLRTAPHLVKPLPFLMPTYGYGSRGSEAMWVGIKLYEALGFGRNKSIPEHRQIPNGKLISKKDCLNIAADINKEGLRGGAIWYDAQVEDADRAVIQVIQDAHEKGACVANYVQAQKLIVEDKQVQGIIAYDNLNSTEFTIQGNMVVNATGPWAGAWLKQNQSHLSHDHDLPLTKSMNIVTRQLFSEHAVGIKSTIASDSVIGSSKRLYFIAPWRGRSIIGTTHFHYGGNIETATRSLKTTTDEIEQFIKEINTAYPVAKLTLEDILYCYQGLTPANDESQHANATRLNHSKVIDHQDEDSLKGLVSLVSIKWTTARGVAEKAVDLIAQRLGNTQVCETHTRIIKDRSITLASGKHLDNDTSNEELEQFVVHAINNEMALSLSDLLFRRCDAVMTNSLTYEQISLMCDVMAKQLKWNKVEQKRQRGTLLESWLQPELHHALSK